MLLYSKKLGRHLDPIMQKFQNTVFFKDCSLATNHRYSSIRPGKKIHDPVINDIKCIRHLPEGIIQVKWDYNANYIDLPVRPRMLQPITQYPQLLKSACKIKKKKWQHLQEIKSVLPKALMLFTTVFSTNSEQVVHITWYE